MVKTEPDKHVRPTEIGIATFTGKLIGGIFRHDQRVM